MPLSPPEARERLHTRSIEINGYRRSDGLYDIEAHLTDTKTFGQSNYDRGYHRSRRANPRHVDTPDRR